MNMFRLKPFKISVPPQKNTARLGRQVPREVTATTGCQVSRASEGGRGGWAARAVRATEDRLDRLGRGARRE